MNFSSLIGLINNAALLLALGLTYDMFGFSRADKGNSIARQLITGLILGIIGIAIMLNPWTFGQGVMFDVRSVLLCISGLFFGTIPVVQGMFMTGAFRMFLGGTGAWTGVGVIVTSGCIGLAWRYLRRRRSDDPTTTELYLLGLVVHATMLAWMFLLPWDIAVGVLSKIALPVILIHPVTTLALGKLLVNRKKRRDANLALEKSEDKFRSIFQYHTAIELLIDPGTGRIVEANEAAENFYGWPGSKLKQMRVQDINTLPPEKVEAELKLAKSLKRNYFEFCHRLADGSVRDVEVYSSKIQLDGKTFLHSIIHDVSDRVQAQKAQQEQEQFLSSVISTTPDGFWVVDSYGYITDVNDACCAMWGYSREEILGKGIWDIDAVEKPEGTATRIERIMANGTETFEAQHKRKDGSTFPVEIAVSYLEKQGGNFVCFGRDLTSRKKQEEHLSLLGRMVDAAPAAIMIHDTDGRMLFANEVTLSSHGYDNMDEFLAVNLHDLDVPESEAMLAKRFRLLAEEGEARFEVVHYRKDGSTFPLEILAKIIVWDGENAVLSVGSDISERKAAEEVMREQREYQQAMISAAPVAIISLASDGRVQSWNPAAERIFGWSEEEVLGRLLPIVPEDQQDVFAGLRKKVMEGEALSQVELMRLRKDGSPLSVALSTAPIRDKNGKITAILSVLEDITERKQAESERDKLQSQLIQSQKMESIGTLAGGIAHDFNNILTPILVQTELAKMTISQDDVMQQNLDEIASAGHRAKDLVKQILTFSRQSDHQQIAMDPVPVAKETLKLLRSSIPISIEIKQKINPGSGTLLSNPTQIQQIIMNLCTNAAHAMLEIGGVLEVTMQPVELNDNDVGAYPDIGAGSYIALQVSDNGYGIKPENVEKIFDPFFTTKAEGEGTGMGLAVVHGIVKSHGGAITVYSEPGKGTCFKVLLPRIEQTPAEVTEEKVEVLPTGRERILFVDDEEQIARLGQQMLERLGYKVETRTSSVEALAAFEARPEKYDLVMTDMTMPNMTGDDLAKELMKARSDIPVILCTGFSYQMNPKKAERIGVQAFIMKPFIMKEIAETIRNVLDGAVKDG